MVGGFASGAVQSGDLKGGLAGAFSAGMFHGIGGMPEGWSKIAAHGVGGGIMADLQGGKFGHGFVSAGVTEVLSPELMRLSSGPFQQVVAAAVVGGTASALSGGKFANGAVTAAFQMAFNHLSWALEAQMRACLSHPGFCPQSFGQAEEHEARKEIVETGGALALEGAMAAGPLGAVRATTHIHHLLPQAKRFKQFFKRAGLDIEDYKIPLDETRHTLKPDGIHTNSGGNWNNVWDGFFQANPKATRQEILDQLDKMRRDFGI